MTLETRQTERAGQSEGGRTTLVVAGGSGAVGQALTARAATLFSTIYNFDRQAPDIGDDDSLVYRLVDLASPAQVDKAVKGLEQHPSHAAFVAGAPATGDPVNVLMQNLLAPLNWWSKIIPAMSDGGSVVFVSSISKSSASYPASQLDVLSLEPSVGAIEAFVRDFNLSARESYAVAKLSLTKWALRESAKLISRRIRVNVVSPGAISTPRLEEYAASAPPHAVLRSASLLGRHAYPSEIADVILYLLVGHGATWINGIDLSIDGGVMNYWAQHRRMDQHENP